MYRSNGCRLNKKYIVFSVVREKVMLYTNNLVEKEVTFSTTMLTIWF